MRFNIRDYTQDHVMHCASQEEADIFVQYLDDNGCRWSSGCSYIGNTHWQASGGGTCYRFATGVRGAYNDYRDGSSWVKPAIILEFSHFDWSEYDLTADKAPTISFDDFLNGLAQ